MQENSSEIYNGPFSDKIADTVCKMLSRGVIARQSRFDQVKKNEDMYNGFNPPALKGRSNIPFDSVVMRGFINTLLANTTEPIDIKYGHTREQDKKSADKVTAVWARESGADRGDWDTKIQDAKKLAALSGRGFLKLNVENMPKFRTDLTVCDHYDMVTEPQGGGDLDKHLYKFQMNIFRTKSELLSAVRMGYYNAKNVAQMIARYQDPDYKKNQDDFKNKTARYAKFGIDQDTEFTGQILYRLTEGVVNFEGDWYYILFSYEAKTAVRLQKLTSVFSYAEKYPGRGPWSSFATMRDPFNFWSVAPADDVHPVGYTMKKIVNLTVDNLEKRNWDMKAYDPRMFTDPVQLLYKQDGLVRATLKPGQNIANGIFQFQTPDTTNITINLVDYLNNFLGQKTGITPDAQGSSKAQQVGILVNNLEQVSKRLTLDNKMFEKTAVDLGVMFDYGVHETLREPIAVKIIGPKGVEWEEEVTRRDTDCDFSCEVKAGDAQERKNAVLSQKKELFFQRVEKNPNLIAKINSNWYLEQSMLEAGFSQEAIRVALDTQNNGDEDVLAEAAQAIADIVDGKPYIALNRGATTGFIQKIIDFATNNYPIYEAEGIALMSRAEKIAYAKSMKVHDGLVSYAQKHLQIAMENMQRNAVAMITKMRMAQAGPGAAVNGAPTPDASSPIAPPVPNPMQV